MITAAQKILNKCEQLARFTESPSKNVLSRRALTEPMKDANALVAVWMEEVGFQTTIDNVGNLIGYAHQHKNAPMLVLGSHLDSVPNGGKYDGPLGVILAIEIFRDIDLASLPFNVEIVAFSDEEGSRFQIKCTGSKAIAGLLEPSVLELKDELGISVREAIVNFGGNPDNIFDQRYKEVELLGFFEFHIEQGITLEVEDVPVGIVSSIVGQTNMIVEFDGEVGHAGTISMHQRSDSLVAAANFITAVESYALRQKGMVATVGKINNFPNVPNCISGKVQLSVDIRHANDEIRERAATDLTNTAYHIGRLRNQKATCEIIGNSKAVKCDADLVTILKNALSDMPHCVLQSGAGHDAMIMGEVAPVAMLFIRCEKGISHRPEENVDVVDVAAALQAGKAFVNEIIVCQMSISIENEVKEMVKQ